jgi:hypothetical protein
MARMYESSASAVGCSRTRQPRVGSVSVTRGSTSMPSRSGMHNHSRRQRSECRTKSRMKRGAAAGGVVAARGLPGRRHMAKAAAHQSLWMAGALAGLCCGRTRPSSRGADRPTDRRCSSEARPAARPTQQRRQAPQLSAAMSSDLQLGLECGSAFEEQGAATALDMLARIKQSTTRENGESRHSGRLPACAYNLLCALCLSARTLPSARRAMASRSRHGTTLRRLTPPRICARLSVSRSFLPPSLDRSQGAAQRCDC